MYTSENTQYKITQKVKPFLYMLIKENDELILRPAAIFSTLAKVFVDKDEINKINFANVVSYVPFTRISNLKNKAILLEKDAVYFDYIFNESIVDYVDGIIHYLFFIQWIKNGNLITEKEFTDIMNLYVDYVKESHKMIFSFLTEKGTEDIYILSEAQNIIKSVAMTFNIIPVSILEGIETSYKDFISNSHTEEMFDSVTD
ncbi:MAG: hypothetical protein KC414_08835, partial [Romboutsia sp.]|nr:hypothetical protein [Romboutsia sp.]